MQEGIVAVEVDGRTYRGTYRVERGTIVRPLPWRLTGQAATSAQALAAVAQVTS